MRPFYLFTGLFLFAFSPSALAEEPIGKPFKVIGEQVEHKIPDGWKLAWMEGKADGRYFAEYIPAGEDINSWRTGYLAIERIPYPSPQILDEIHKMKTTFSEIGLHHFMEIAAKRCGEKHIEMSRRVNTFNGVFFAVSGGFCDHYDNIAPFGEGAFVAFLEGKNNVFRIQYSWRPISEATKNNDLPWRIPSNKAEAYLNAIKATTLCGGESQPNCTINLSLTNQ